MTYTVTSLAPPRIAQRDAMLIFGLGHHYHRSNAGIPSQWDRFVPHLGNITGQVDNIAYGVICNTEENGSIDYICGVEVREFPTGPAEFMRLRIRRRPVRYSNTMMTSRPVSTTWRAIWNHALSTAGNLAMEGPAYERYDERFDPRTGHGGLEILIPIKG